MTYETIQFEMRGATALLTLNRPDALNALTVSMGQELKAAIGEALETGARALILTGAGRAFCAGGDLREMKKMAEQEGRIEAFFDEPLRLLNDCILLIRQTPIPFIAAVNGAASGGGCSLALACDLIWAAESAYFGLGRIGADQLREYAGRKGFDLETMARWLAPNLDDEEPARG